MNGTNNDTEFNGQIIWQDKKRPLFGLPISFTTYTLYPEKLITDMGILLRREEEVRLYRIVDFSVRQTLFQRMFNIGTIHCYSADNSAAEFDITEIKDPYKIKDLLSDIVEKERQNHKVVTGEFMN